ncbi:MAG TPA: M48 family metalloprotease [Candidatus Acidoferrum sp.]|nr:M48 family metalloprotease [Candidatus Acidoferrum sp.]
MARSHVAEAVSPPPKLKVRGYLTARTDETTVAILDDQIHFGNAKVVSHDSSGEHPLAGKELAVGMLVEAEGIWTGHHQFTAERVTVDAGLLEKQIHDTAYLQEEPRDMEKIKKGEPGELKVDGEWLLVDSKTKRSWAAPEAAVVNTSDASSAKEPGPGDPGASSGNPGNLAGYRVEYHGMRLTDGKIAAERVELGQPAPVDAYKMPHGLEIVPAKDPQTGIDVLEFRRGKKVDGRMKLFPDKTVQTYVSDLGDSLLPAGSKGTKKALEFRFFVVEDSSINAAALPDGTVLVNTALLGAVENEAQLAFVLSHEISHVLQVHYWREVHETRPQRISLLIAGIAAGAFIGDLGLFMAELGMISVINGHQRELENQADRLGLQNVIEHGYDPRPAPGFSRIIIDRYGARTTSKLWSNHDSAVLRGSFLTVQLIKQYPDHHFDGARVNTAGFDAMKDALGPVKIE